MNEKFYAEWLKLSNEDRVAVFQETANRKGLPAAAIEKDWWVEKTDHLTTSCRFRLTWQKLWYSDV